MAEVYLNTISWILLIMVSLELSLVLKLRYGNESSQFSLLCKDVERMFNVKFDISVIKYFIEFIFVLSFFILFKNNEIATLKIMMYAYFALNFLRTILGVIASYAPMNPEITGISSELILSKTKELLVKVVIAASIIIALAFYKI